MARLVQRDTGSVVNVPDEKADNVAAYGYFDREEPNKAPVKKSAAKKSDK